MRTIDVPEQLVRQVIENGLCERAREVAHGERSIQALPDEGICAFCDLAMVLLCAEDGEP